MANYPSRAQEQKKIENWISQIEIKFWDEKYQIIILSS